MSNIKTTLVNHKASGAIIAYWKVPDEVPHMNLVPEWLTHCVYIDTALHISSGHRLFALRSNNHTYFLDSSMVVMNEKYGPTVISLREFESLHQPLDDQSITMPVILESATIMPENVGFNDESNVVFNFANHREFGGQFGREFNNWLEHERESFRRAHTDQTAQAYELGFNYGYARHMSDSNLDKQFKKAEETPYLTEEPTFDETGPASDALTPEELTATLIQSIEATTARFEKLENRLIEASVLNLGRVRYNETRFTLINNLITSLIMGQNLRGHRFEINKMARLIMSEEDEQRAAEARKETDSDEKTTHHPV